MINNTITNSRQIMLISDYDIFVVTKLNIYCVLCTCMHSKCLLAILHSIHLTSTHAFTAT